MTAEQRTGFKTSKPLHSLFLLLFLAVMPSQAAARMDQTTYNEAVRVLMTPENYTQAFTAFEGIGPAIVVVVLVPLLWNLLYAGFIKEWDCDNYWLIFLSTAVVAIVMLLSFPYLLMVL